MRILICLLALAVTLTCCKSNKRMIRSEVGVCIYPTGRSCCTGESTGYLDRGRRTGDGEKGESRFDGRCRFDAVLYYCREFYLPAECDQLAVGPDAPRIFGLFDYAE